MLKKLSVSFSLFLATQAVVPTALAYEGDPFESVNRQIHDFNLTVDDYVLKPLAKGYDYITPDVAQKAVSNFFNNLFYPTVIANQFLQGKPDEGMQGVTRFTMNTLIGIGGLIDVAHSAGLKAKNEDFGQTFSLWGMPRGPFIVLPFLGPSTPTDTLGEVAGTFSTPAYYIDHNSEWYAAAGLYIVDERAAYLGIDDIQNNDNYAFMRDAYLQRRNYLIADGEVNESDPFLEDW